jgi:hypothetical protein
METPANIDKYKGHYITRNGDNAEVVELSDNPIYPLKGKARDYNTNWTLSGGVSISYMNDHDLIMCTRSETPEQARILWEEWQLKIPDLKEIVKDNQASFIYACAGELYYKVTVNYKSYQFPIDMNNKEDVGTSVFPAICKAITLMRYIRKALENETFTLTNK